MMAGPSYDKMEIRQYFLINPAVYTARKKDGDDATLAVCPVDIYCADGAARIAACAVARAADFWDCGAGNCAAGRADRAGGGAHRRAYRRARGRPAFRDIRQCY